MSETATSPSRTVAHGDDPLGSESASSASGPENPGWGTEASVASGESLGKALARAPLEDEEIDADELRAIREGREDFGAGRAVTARQLEREPGN